MRQKKTTLFFIFSIITFLTVLFLLIFFFNVIKNKNIHTRATLITLEDKIKDNEKEKILKQKISEVENTNENLKNYYLNPEEIDIFVTYIENIGNSIDAKITFKNVEVSTMDKMINFKILITGSFSRIIQSIELLENIPYQINISQLFLNKSIGNQNSTNEKLSNQMNIEGLKNEETIILNETEWQADLTFSVLSI